MEKEGEEDQVSAQERRYFHWQVKSPEIVEIGEDSSRNGVTNDVYIAVGKNDLDVVKWALDNHQVTPATQLFLVHVFPSITYIPTPGMHKLLLISYLF